MRLRLKNSNGCWIGNNNKKDHRWFDCTCKQQTVASQKQTKIACKASVINLRFVSHIPMMKKKHILRNECLISHVRWQFYAVFLAPRKKSISLFIFIEFSHFVALAYARGVFLRLIFMKIWKKKNRNHFLFVYSSSFSEAKKTKCGNPYDVKSWARSTHSTPHQRKIIHININRIFIFNIINVKMI